MSEQRQQTLMRFYSSVHWLLLQKSSSKKWLSSEIVVGCYTTNHSRWLLLAFCKTLPCQLDNNSLVLYYTASQQMLQLVWYEKRQTFHIFILVVKFLAMFRKKDFSLVSKRFLNFPIFYSWLTTQFTNFLKLFTIIWRI